MKKFSIIFSHSLCNDYCNARLYFGRKILVQVIENIVNVDPALILWLTRIERARLSCSNELQVCAYDSLFGNSGNQLLMPMT